ncbi:MAG: PEP-CTERM sorting domain-containing protein [Fimbriimonadales bacterium]
MKKFTLLSLALLAASAFSGPIGTWMLTDGDAGMDAMIQGANVNTYAQGASTNLQYAIAWNSNYLGGTFMTVGRDINGLGGVYDLSHTQVDTFTNFSTISGEHLDGTMDTSRNITYASNFSTGDVVRYNDQYFNGPVSSIYNAGSFALWTITYNAQRDSLYLGGANGAVTEIDINGNVVNSFSVNDGTIRSLAYDPNDASLWYLTNNGAEIVQMDALGLELARETVNLGGNYWGGEIAAVPEPATFVALGLGVAALAFARRRK